MNDLRQFAYLGRSQGPELFQSIQFAPNSQFIVPKPINLNRPMEALIFNLRGRVGVTVANYGSVAVEAPQTLLNRITIRGTFKGNALTPVDLSGASLFAERRLFNTKGNEFVLGSASPTLQGELSQPFGGQPANFLNVGNYDFDITYVLPMAPWIAMANKRWDNTRYFWYAKDWQDTLQVTVGFGDTSSLGVVGGATVALTAFGSAAGVPTLNIFSVYSLLGDFKGGGGAKTSCLVRNESNITAGLAANASNQRLVNLQKLPTTNLIFKTGLSQATSAGLFALASLSDTILDFTQPMNDNKAIRVNSDNRLFKNHHNRQWNTTLPQGYLVMSFIDSQTGRTAYRADNGDTVNPGADFAVYSNVIGGAATAVLGFQQHYIVKEADDPYWLGTK